MADTYDRRIQLDASRLRYEDARSLQKSGRWNGAIYLAGYAIECSLKALICYEEGKLNLKDTRMFQKASGATLHNLGALCQQSKILKHCIELEGPSTLKSAWTTIVSLWHLEELRYGRNLGYKADCNRFLAAVEELYPQILKWQKVSF